MTKYVSDKGTSTNENILIDKAVNTKERYFPPKEDIMPFPVDIRLNTRPDTFETDPSQSDKNLRIQTDFDIANAEVEPPEVCFSPYPHSSNTSFSETSENYLKLCTRQ